MLRPIKNLKISTKTHYPQTNLTLLTIQTANLTGRGKGFTAEVTEDTEFFNRGLLGLTGFFYFSVSPAINPLSIDNRYFRAIAKKYRIISVLIYYSLDSKCNYHNMIVTF